ncbi:hypothetical protein [Pseudanabaena sp. FACHB-2040]|uniref:hypothetical protein n=1 Tax=Pseudanabaena sp. FACHB-2040 TaxID=2692859 RepID=UPI001682536F|nr:hypothetical protein [Pseudanabaena sp. FACHB-2040]MBD2256733.1 hypothetical protein [Pseudanabaena sp. FACHB-2040]
MGTQLAVAYCLVSEEHNSRAFESWNDATALLDEIIDNEGFDISELRVSTCKHGWYLDLLMRICKGTQIQNLEFASVRDFWSVICAEQLEAAKESLEKVLEFLESGIPNLGEWEDDKVEDLRKDLNAFEQADVDFRIDDYGFDANQSFCSHIKTLHFTVNEALEKGKCLLYFFCPS